MDVAVLLAVRKLFVEGDMEWVKTISVGRFCSGWCVKTGSVDSASCSPTELGCSFESTELFSARVASSEPWRKTVVPIESLPAR